MLFFILLQVLLAYAMPFYWPSFTGSIIYRPKFGICVFDLNNFWYLLLLVMWMHSITMLVGFYSYMKILQKVFLSKVRVRGTISMTDLKTYKCLLIIFGFYLFSKIPELILMTDHLHLIIWPVIWDRVAMIMLSVNAAVNPFITGFFNPDFSPFFKHVFGLKEKNNQRNGQPTNKRAAGAQPQSNRVRNTNNSNLDWMHWNALG